MQTVPHVLPYRSVEGEMRMRNVRNAIIVFALLALGLGTAPAQQRNSTPVKPRVVITADPELDDNNTLIRALLYSTDFKVEGLVYTSSQFHWKGDGKGTTQYLPG